MTEEQLVAIFKRELEQSAPLSREEEARLLADYKKTGNQESRDKLIVANLRFIFKEAAKMRRPGGQRLLDLVQAGVLGLHNAIEKYDPERGVRLLSFAKAHIQQQMGFEVRRMGSAVNIPLNVINYAIAATRAHPLLPVDEAIRARYANWPNKDKARSALNAAEHVANALRPPTGIPGYSNRAKFGDDDIRQGTSKWTPAYEEDAYGQIEIAADFEKIVSVAREVAYSERNFMIFMRIWVDGEPYYQVGADYGLCRERIRQICNELIYKIRKRLGIKAEGKITRRLA